MEENIRDAGNGIANLQNFHAIYAINQGKQNLLESLFLSHYVSTRTQKKKI